VPIIIVIMIQKGMDQETVVRQKHGVIDTLITASIEESASILNPFTTNNRG